MGKRALGFFGIAFILLVLLGGMAGWLLGNAANDQQSVVSPSSRETLSSPAPESVEVMEDSEPSEEEKLVADEQEEDGQATGDEFEGITADTVPQTRRTVPRLPDTLQSADHVVADEVDIYLISGKEYTLMKAARKDHCSLQEAVQELVSPSQEQRQQGFLAAIPEQAELEILGLDGDILYILVMLSKAEQLAFVNEALMYDALTLTSLGFSEIRHVQYVIDPSLGYQGVADIREPHDEDTLFTSHWYSHISNR